MTPCHGKTKFATFAQATAQAARGTRAYDMPISAYHCKSCQAWHIGNRRKLRLTRAVARSIHALYRNDDKPED